MHLNAACAAFLLRDFNGAQAHSQVRHRPPPSCTGRWWEQTVHTHFTLVVTERTSIEYYYSTSPCTSSASSKMNGWDISRQLESLPLMHFSALELEGAGKSRERFPA